MKGEIHSVPVPCIDCLGVLKGHPKLASDQILVVFPKDVIVVQVR